MASSLPKQKKPEEISAEPLDKLKLVAKKPHGESNRVLGRINELVDLTLGQLNKDREMVLGMKPKKNESGAQAEVLAQKAWDKLDKNELSMLTGDAERVAIGFVRKIQQR